MDYLDKIIIALGIEPKIAFAILAILSTFLIVIVLLYICVPFILLRIRKEIIEMNKNLRILYILEAHDRNTVIYEAEGNENKNFDDNKPSKKNKKFELDDEDIKKLKAIGVGIE
jgi:hypothetical protein